MRENFKSFIITEVLSQMVVYEINIQKFNKFREKMRLIQNLQRNFLNENKVNITGTLQNDY